MSRPKPQTDLEWRRQMARDLAIQSRRGRGGGGSGPIPPGLDAAVADLIGGPTTVTLTRAATDRSYKVSPSVLMYGAKGDGVTDDTAAIAAAHAASDVVMYPDGEYTPGANYNLYGSADYTNALGPRWMGGIVSAPLSRAEPVMWVQKHSSSTRATDPTEWDQGAGYFALIKQSGDAYGAGLTGYARHMSADGGQIIGIHGRAAALTLESQVWGMWSYAYNPAGVPAQSVIGHEINIVNKDVDQGWRETGSSAGGISRGLVIVTADGSNPVTQGLYIGNNSAAPNGQFHSGFYIKGGGIVPSAVVSSTIITNNEAIRLEGTALSADAYNAIRLRNGWFRTGISFTEASFDSNAAIVFGDGHRIVVGPGAGVTRYVSFNVTNSHVNFSNLFLRVNNVQVVRDRRTGWAAMTGTATRTAIATSTATVTQLAERFKALVDDLISHGLIGA